MAGKSQAEYWNDEAGPKWVEHADALDSMLAPFLEKIMARAKLRSTDRVLDIGCGAGALSLRAARNAGHVTGVDVSEPLLNLARQRASYRENINFHHGDAADMWTASTDPFDIALSRVGVMFFEKPVKAFQNILELMSDRPSLVFACWRHPKYNPWATLPIQIVAPILPSPPAPPDLESPGPFAFAERDRVRSILQASGWSNVEINTFDIDLTLPGKTTDEAAGFMVKMGPLGRMLADTELDLENIQTRLARTLEDCVNAEGQVSVAGSAWIVEAGSYVDSASPCHFPEVLVTEYPLQETLKWF